MHPTNTTRRPLTIHNQENQIMGKMKAPVSKSSIPQLGLRPRTALGSISSNVQTLPVHTFGKPSIVADKNKNPPLKPVTKYHNDYYKNVQSKIDTRLPSKVTTGFNKEKPSLLQNKENISVRKPVSINVKPALKITETKVASSMTVKTRSTTEALKNKTESFQEKIDSLDNQLKKLEPVPESSRRISSYSSRQLFENVKDIDAGHDNSPILMSIYIKDIYSYLHELEMKFRIRPSHLEGHVEVTSRMRELLLDWIIEIHENFNLMLETLHMTISIIDRYLQMDKSLKKKELQLLGVTAMFIASKYEEMFAPDISDFVHSTGNTYSKSEIIQFEKNVLVKLNFSFGRPLPLHFLRRFVKAANLTVRHHTMCKYLIELSFLSYDLAHCHPSELAAACVCLSIALLSSNISFEDCWDNTLTYYSGYSYVHIADTVEKVAKVLNNVDKSHCKATKKKYNVSKYRKISSCPELDFVKTCLEQLSKNRFNIAPDLLKPSGFSLLY